MSLISVHGLTGVDVDSSSRNLNYMMGLSDFFAFVFEDKEVLNLMMEANAITASDVYSSFLQRTSTLSLENIQQAVGSSIKLLLIKESDRIGNSSTFNVRTPIQSAAVLSNRPFLPTEYLEEGADFRIVQKDLTYCTIQFAKALANYKFSQRITSDGEIEYAIWATDCVIDEGLIQNTFGYLLGLEPEMVSEGLMNLIYGLNFLYFNGPTFKRLEQGLNLALGVPVARETEVILDIRNYLDTDGYFVITPNNQYVVAAGSGLEVSIGQEITIGQPLTRWIELKDFQTSGKWWLGLKIPRTIISIQPSSQNTRFANEGSYYDWIMSNYLFHNTFLVTVHVDRVRQSNYYDRVIETLSKVKPAYTQYILNYKVELEADELEYADIEDTGVNNDEEQVLTIGSTTIGTFAVGAD